MLSLSSTTSTCSSAQPQRTSVWLAFRLLRVPTPSTPLARTGATANGGGGGAHFESKCKLCDARVCFGTTFTTCYSFNKKLDLPETTTRGERRYVNLCRQYIAENPTVKTLKKVKIKVKKKPAETGAPAAAPAAAATAGKDKVITPIIDISALRNLLGDDEIGDEDDFDAWIRAQDGSFQGINALIDGSVEIVAENVPDARLTGGA